MPPGIALKTAVARYAPLRLHLADRAGLNLPVSTCPLAALFVPAMGLTPPGPNADVVQKRSGRFCPAASPRCAPAFSPVFLTRLNPRAVLPWPSRCDILAEGFSAAEWSAWNNRTCRRGLARLKIAEAQAAGGGKPYRASPNSQTAETKVSRCDDFSCRNAGFPGPGESGPGAFTCSAGNRNMVNGIFPRTYVPECEAPFTPATVYRLALVGDKPKKAGHLSVTRMTGFRGCRSSPDVRGRRQGTTTS